MLNVPASCSECRGVSACQMLSSCHSLGDIMKGNGRIKDAGAGKDFFQFMKQKQKGNKQSSFSAWLFEQIYIKIINKKKKWNCPIWSRQLAAQPANTTLSHRHDWKPGQKTHTAAAARGTTDLKEGLTVLFCSAQ